MFCPECGKEGEELIDGLCLTCFLKGINLAEIPSTIKVKQCVHCNATLQGVKWVHEELDELDIVYDALEENITLHPFIESQENKNVSMEITNIRGTIAECLCEVSANVDGRDVKGKFKTNVVLKNIVCPDCSKKTSGYFESVIQLRADGRKLKNEEIHEADNIIRSNIDRLSKKDRLAYVADRVVLKEGIDYYIGSNKSAKKLINAIKNVLGGTTKESARLISQDKSTGKGLYRIWMSLRLPKFKIGDFIKYADKIAKITSFDSSKIYYLDLKTLSKNSILWKEYDEIEFIKQSEDAETTSIISKSPSNIQILDPETYEAIDISSKDGLNHLNIGDEINILKYENQFYIIPTDES